MKKITKFLVALSLVLSVGAFSRVSATEYCDFAINSTRATGYQTAYISCQSLGGDQYEFKFVSENEIVSWNALGSNFYAEVNGVGGTQVSNSLVKSSDSKTLTWTVTSSPKPNFYVGALFVNYADGEHQFNIPTDEDFAAVCGSVVVDTEIPTAFTATKGAVGANSVELLLNATDNSGSIKYTISYGATPTELNTTGVSATQKSYVVTGLTPGTAYSFSVVAKDAAGNVAVASPITVLATTTVIPAAPVPAHTASQVISVYNDLYTNLPTDLQNWYGNTFSSVTLDGNATMMNSSICCFGYEFTAKPIDVSSMTKLHVDIYPTTLATMSFGVTDGADRMKSGIALIANQWNSVDVTLSELNANLTAINQVGFWNLNGAFYFDNLYFYTDATTAVAQVSEANSISCYPNPMKDQLNISAASEIKQVLVNNLLGQSVKAVSANSAAITVDISSIPAGNYFVSIKLANGQVSTQKVVKL